MKKNLKIMALAMLLVVLAGAFSSCKKEYKRQVVYGAGIDDNNFTTIGEWGSIQNYLVEKGALAVGEYKSYTVTSKKGVDDCYEQTDAMARTDFANATSNLKVEEAQALLKPGVYFNYSWTRTDEAGNIVEICRWECPAKPVPQISGKITIDGVDHTVKTASKMGLTAGGFPATSIFLSTVDDVTFTVIVKNMETAGQVPVGDFEISVDSNVGSIDINDAIYALTGSLKVSLDGNSYKIESSGIGKNVGSRDINFTINCENVVF